MATKAISNPSKRTANHADLDQPTPVMPQTLSTSSASSSFLLAEEEIEDLAEEEIKDELYCVMTTTVVGIQYYKGWPSMLCLYFFIPLT